MNTFLQRLLKAYRPLYLRGLLLDGRNRLPIKRRADDAASLDGVDSHRLPWREPARDVAAMSSTTLSPSTEPSK